MSKVSGIRPPVGQREPKVEKEELFELIKKGAREWNQWRAQNKNSPLILDGIELKKVELDGINLSGCSMKGANITQCSFKNANFISAGLQKAVLAKNDFSGAKLIATNFEGADLSESILTNANILTATIRRAKLYKIDFHGHDLGGLDLTGASFARCNLEGQQLSRLDLSEIDFEDANLRGANLSYSHFAKSNFRRANLTETQLKGAEFRGADLAGVDFRGTNLEGLDFHSADLSNCDLREANLQTTSLAGANVSGAKLWRIKTHGWDISNISCTHAFWDKSGKEKTSYRNHEFERIYAEATIIELQYPYRLTANELATLPILIEHLQATQWGTILRLKSIRDVAGGALVTLVVEESGKHNPTEVKAELQEEADRIQTAQLALRSNRDLQDKLKEEIAGLKEKFWPRLLELAAEHEREQVRTLTVVFMDLKDFSSWAEDELSEKLSLFRGLVKPILNKWQASYPNMEGDSLRVTFRNATAGLACACMMRGVLTAAGFEVRVGVELGEVAVVHNEVTDISDLEGTAVSMAARLESVADAGQVLATQKVRHYTDYKGIFKFSPKKVKLSKHIGNMKQGDIVECYAVDMIKPALDFS